jgi:chemotaxis protein MotD
MLDIDVSGAPSAADAAKVSRGGRSGKTDDGDRKGFLDAMSGSRSSGRKSDGTASKQSAATDAGDDTSDPNTTAPSDAASVTDDPTKATAAAGASAGKNVKVPDLLKGAGAGPRFAKSLIDFQQQGTANPVPDQVVTPPAQDPAVAKSLDDIAQQLADAVAANQPAATTDDAKGADKPTKGADLLPTDDKTASATDTQAAGSASDALSLLNVPPVAVPVVAPNTIASAFVAANGQTQAMPDQPMPKLPSVTSVKGLVSDAGDATDDTVPGISGDASDQVFRLTRADGRGQSLDMSIGRDADDAPQLDVKAASGGNAETVTVLDSRRFLGLAPGSNSSLVAGALSGDREWSSAMQPSSGLSNAASWTSTGKVVNTLKIQMNPINLGLVTATMRLSGDQLTVDLKVQSGEAYRQLRDDQNAMIDSLRSQGYSVDKITVTLAAPAQTDTGSQSDLRGQSQQQQQLPNQGQGGEAQARRQNYSGQQADGSDGARTNMGADDGISGGSLPGRSGGVYL